MFEKDVKYYREGNGVRPRAEYCFHQPQFDAFVIENEFPSPAHHFCQSKGLIYRGRIWKSIHLGGASAYSRNNMKKLSGLALQNNNVPRKFRVNQHMIFA